RAMNMAPFIFWNLAFYTIIRTQLALELLLAIEEEFGIALYDENMVVLGSINKIADFIEENKEG
ncbi:hypothetical protein ABNC90_21170, partial [Paenibacillus larvae]